MKLKKYLALLGIAMLVITFVTIVVVIALLISMFFWHLSEDLGVNGWWGLGILIFVSASIPAGIVGSAYLEKQK
jgi:hypothetical protein